LKVASVLVPLYDPSGAYLLVVSKSGVHRFRLRPARGEDGQTPYGQSTGGEDDQTPYGQSSRVPLPLQSPVSSAALDAGGHKLIVVESLKKALVIDPHPDAGPASPILTGHDHMNYVDISPDGEWAATSAFKGNGDVKVWDLKTGRPVRTFRTEERARAAFSLDGRWLVVVEPRQGVLSCYRVGSWEKPVRQERLEPGDGFLAFTKDGLMAVTAQGGRAIRLEDAATGHPWAILPSLGGEELTYPSFSSNGGLLSVTAGERTVELWDLRALRARLAEMGLD
jgi:WD40 repeat protein